MGLCGSVVKGERKLKLATVLVSFCACKGRGSQLGFKEIEKKERKGRMVPRLVQPELPVEASFFF